MLKVCMSQKSRNTGILLLLQMECCGKGLHKRRRKGTGQLFHRKCKRYYQGILCTANLRLFFRLNQACLYTRQCVSLMLFALGDKCVGIVTVQYKQNLATLIFCVYKGRGMVVGEGLDPPSFHLERMTAEPLIFLDNACILSLFLLLHLILKA